MYVIFGEFFSVAALIKASPFWLHPGARLIENSVGAKTTALKSLATTAALVFLVVYIVRRRREPATHNIFLVCVSAIAFLGIHLIAARMRNWYWVPPMALLAAAINHCTRTKPTAPMPRSWSTPFQNMYPPTAASIKSTEPDT